MDLASITPIILTYNEARNIERCLAGLTWARRVVVVDSGSQDSTAAIVARHANASLFVRAFDNHASQWNHALTATAVETAWVLALDADFVVGPDFVAELRDLEPPADIAGFRCGFTYCVDGAPLRGSLYPPLTVLFRRQSGRFRQDGHTQRLELAGNVRAMKSKLRHDDRKDLTHWLASQARYMRLEADKLRAATWSGLDWADRVRKLRLVAPVSIFLYCLFGRGLILDGRAGLYYSLQRAMAEAILSLTLLRDDMAPPGAGS